MRPSRISVAVAPSAARSRTVVESAGAARMRPEAIANDQAPGVDGV